MMGLERAPLMFDQPEKRRLVCLPLITLPVGDSWARSWAGGKTNQGYLHSGGRVPGMVGGVNVIQHE